MTKEYLGNDITKYIFDNGKEIELDDYELDELINDFKEKFKKDLYSAMDDLYKEIDLLF